jgi:YD repeat-containing protein
MVAVITGNGLGLGNTSLTQLGQSQGGSPSLGQAANRSYVNSATGNLILQSADEGMLFDGLPLNVLRTYNSLGQLSSNGWSYGFSRTVNGLTGTLNTAGSTITRTDDDGSSVVYAYNATLGVYQSTNQSGAIDTLSWNATSSTWTWTDAASSTQETYNATGQLTALTDTSSGASYSFSYSNGQLAQITAGDGDTLIFGYNTSHQLISLSIQEVPPGQSTAVTRQAVSYGYDSQGRLTSVTTTLASDTNSNTTASYTTTYTYQGGSTDLISRVTQSDGTTVSYSYTQDAQGAYQVTGITTGSGPAAQTLTLSYGTNSTTVTDGLGNVTTYQTNAQGQLTNVIAPAVNGASPTTTYTYDANGNLLTRTDPNGAITTYQYDANGNVLSVEDGAGNTVTYTYNAADQVTSKTTYTVPAQGEVGQSGYVAPSGAETTYYVYNATHQLAYTIDALGAVTEHDYTTVNGLSELTTTRQYLGATYSTSSNSPSNPPTLSQLQAWVQGSAVQGTLAQSTRTDYVYDVRGQLATQTQYDTVDANGNGVLTSGTVITTTTYDVQGRLLQTSTETGANRSTLQTTTYAYDGLGRVLSKTDPLGNVTSYVYTDSANTIVITQANGLTTTQVRNNAGQLLSSTQSDSTQTVQQINLTLIGTSGLFTKTAQISYQSRYITDSSGTARWVLGGFVTITTAQNSQTLSTRSYATPLTAAQMAQLQASPIYTDSAKSIALLLSLLTPSTNDQINLYIYANGQRQAQVQYGTSTFYNSDGTPKTVTGELATTYKGNTVRYATPLTLAQVESLGDTPALSALQALLTSSPDDQTSIWLQQSTSSGTTHASVQFLTLTNASGVQVPGEYVSISQANSSGQTSNTLYATPLTAAQLASLGSSPTVAQIQALVTPSTFDQTTLYAYDSNGRVVAEVDYLSNAKVGQNADGTYQYLPAGEYIMLTQYNTAGQKTGYTTYATPLTAGQMASLGTPPSVAQIQALVTTSSNDYSGLYVYNSQGQLQASICPTTFQNASGTQYGYFATIVNFDSSGNQVGETQYATPLTASQVTSLGSSPTLAQIQALVLPSNSDQISFITYDAVARQEAEVTYQSITTTNASGGTSTVVEEFITIITHDSSGRIVETRQYVTPVTPTQIVALGSSPTVAQLLSLVTPTDSDQISLNIYDTIGNLVATVSYQTNDFPNPDGTVNTVTGEFLTLSGNSSSTFGASGLISSVTQASLCKTPLTPAQLAALVQSPTTQTLQGVLAQIAPSHATTYLYNAEGQAITAIDPAGNVTYSFYNADGEVAGTVDGDGNVTAYTYDADGHVIQTTHYATQINPLGWLSNGALTSSYPASLPIPASTVSDRITTTLYNAAGQVVATIDPAGNVTTTMYDGAGHALATTQYATPLSSTQRSSLGNPPTLANLTPYLAANASNRTTLTIVDADGRAVASIDAQGYVTVTSYNAAGEAVLHTAYATALTASQLSSLGDTPTLTALQADITPSAQDQTTRTYYDGTGRGVATIDADGYLTTTTYDETTNTSTATRYATALTGNQLSALTGSESVATLVGLLGSNTAHVQSSVTTNVDGQVTSRTAIDGTVTTYNYNSVGQVLSTTVTPASGQGSARTTSATYDAFGDTLTRTDAASATTTTVYNALGQPVEATDALGNSTWSYYDADGRLLYTIQGQTGNGTRNTLGNVTAYQYNAFGEVTSTTTYAAPLTLTAGASSGSTLNPIGASVAQVASAIAALGAASGDANAVTTATYTLDGQVASVTDGNGYQTAVTYDAFGDVIQQQQQLSQPGSTLSASNSAITTHAYDNRGEQLNETDGAGSSVARTTSATYDAFGRVTSRTDGNGNTVTYSYDALGRQVSTSQTVQGATRTTQTTYDAFGRMLSETDAFGNVTTFTYNAATHASTMTTPGGITTTMVKNAYGDTVSVTDGGGNTTTYTYDADGRLLTTTDALGNLASNQYDADGDLIQATDANGHVVTYTYDASGRVPTQTVDPAGLNLATTYSYDGQGRTLSITDPAGSVTTYSYDADGNELTKVVNAGTGQLNLTTTYTYDGAGKTLTVTMGAGTSAAVTRQYVYDNLERLSQIIVDPGTGQLNLTTAYTYDASDNLIAKTDANGNVTRYVYDGAGEKIFTIDPTGAVTQNWYDVDGRLTATRGYATVLTASQLSALGSAPTVAAITANLNASSSDSYQQSVYNADGQVVYVLNSTALYATQITYNSAGLATQTRQYANPLSSTSISQTAAASTVSGVVTASSHDIVTTTAYNADGEAVYTIDGVGDVTQTFYDAAGQVTRSIAYATPLTTAQMSGLGSAPTVAQVAALTATSANDRSTYTSYDAAGRPVYTINAVGTVTQISYDADGRKTSVHVYATPLTSAQLSALGNSPTPAMISPTASASDEIAYRVYDAAGELRYAINSMGHVVETRYDATGKAIETLAYANAVSTSGETGALQAGTALSWISGTVGGTGGSNPDSSAEAALYLYDAAGRGVFVVRQNANGTVGQVSAINYDSNGNATSQTIYGNTLTLSGSQSLSAQLTTASVANAVAGFASRETINTVYDADNRAIYSIDALGDVTQYSYDGVGRLIDKQQYANPIVMPSSINASSIAAAVTAAGGATGARLESATYDSLGHVLTTRDALGVRATYTYNALGQKTSYTNRDGAIWNYSYDAAGRQVQTQSPAVTLGSYSGGALQTTANQYLYTSNSYDTFGDLVGTSQGYGTSAGNITNVSNTSYTYDAVGNQVSTTNALGNTSTTTYNALGQAVVTKDANGNYRYKVYNANGQLADVIDGNGYITSFTYDAYGNVTGETAYATALNVNAITGWGAGQPLTLAQLQQGLVTSASDRSISTSYDQLNRKTQVLQSSISYILGMGSLAGTGMPAAQPTTTYTYDAYGNLTSTSVLMQNALTSGSTTIPAVWATTYNYYDALNRQVMTVVPTGSYSSPQGYVTTTAYNAFGNVASSTQYAQAISTSGVTTASMPALPAASTMASGANRVTTYAYDGIGRLQSETQTGGYNYTGGTLGAIGGGTVGYTTASSVTSYTYNGENQILTETINGATTSKSYDALGRVLTVTSPARQALVSNWQSILATTPGDDLTTAALYTLVSPVTTYVYDALGDVVSTAVSGTGAASQHTFYQYDALGQVTELVDANGNISNAIYDKNGNLIAQNYTLAGNGGSTTVTTAYAYDANNQLLSTAVQRSGVSTYDSYVQQKYNAFGEVVGKGDNNGYELTYAYDNDGNLIGATDPKNGAQHSYAYDLDGHQLLDSSLVTGSNTTTTFTHNYIDLSGRVVQKKTPATDNASGPNSALSFSYDRWGNVIATTDANGNITTYEYDSQNHQIQETEANVLVVSATGTRTWVTPTKEWYYNVNGELMASTDENANSTWNGYDAVGNLIVSQDGAGVRTYTAYDALGRALARQTPPVQAATTTVSRIAYTTFDNLNQVIGQGDFELNAAGTARVQVTQGTYVLNSNGDRIQSTDAMGNATYYSYDSQHHVLSSQTALQHAAGQSETYAYDVNGNLIKQTNADGQTQTWVYDYFGHVHTHVDESGATYTYTYDANSGLLITETSNWTASGPSASPTATLNFSYMANGQIAQLNETVGGAATSYSYQYDANGNEILETSSTQDGAGTAISSQTVLTYDSHNRLQELTLENGVGTAVTMRTVYNYDADGNRRAVFASSAYDTGGTNIAATPIALTPGNPTLTASAQTAQPGNSFNYTPAFSDPLGMGLTYAATSTGGGALPSWLSFNTTTGAFTGTAPAAPGSWNITVTATDALGRSVTTSFAITVPTVAPVFTSAPANQVLTPGAAINYQAPVATDANGYAVTYSATGMPAGVSFNASTRTFSGTPPTAGATYTITYTATSSAGTKATASFTITVPNVAPAFTGGVSNQTVQPGGSLNYQAPAATDANGYGVTYSVSGLPAGISFNASTRTFSGSLTTQGTYTVTYTATATTGGQAASQTFVITVPTVTPVFSGGMANQTATATLAMNAYTAPAATDANGASITYSASGMPPGISFNASTRVFSGTPTTAGTYTVTYTATASTGTVASASFTFTVNAASAPVVVQGGTGIPAKLTFGRSGTAQPVVFSNPMGRPLSYSISWPNGNGIRYLTINSSGVLVYSPPALNGVGGYYYVNITATDPVDGLSFTATTIEIDLASTATAAVATMSTSTTTSTATPTITAAATPAATPTPSPTPNVQADWFTYDADNRVLVNNGSLQNGQIVITSNIVNSGINGYDAAGDQVAYTTVNSSGQSLSQKDYYNVEGERSLITNTTYGGTSYASHEQFTYDADGRVITDVVYQVAGHIEPGTYNGATTTFSDGGWVASEAIYTYNAGGELVDESYYEEDTAQDLINKYGTAVDSSAYATQDTAPPSLPTVGSSTAGALYLASEDSYAASSGYGYDADGNLLGYHIITTSNLGQTAGTVNAQDTYVLQNSALVATTTGSSGTTTNTYNDLAELAKTVNVNGSTTTTSTMAYNATGQITQDTTGMGFSVFAYDEGQGVGSINNQGAFNLLNTSSGYSNSETGTQSYVVQNGETLQSVAEAVYGNSDYSYIIAQANGLQTNSLLVAGTMLHIPEVISSGNTSTTFQPYRQGNIVNANASACVTTAQLITNAIQTMLNQQAQVLQQVAKIEQQRAKAPPGTELPLIDGAVGSPNLMVGNDASFSPESASASQPTPTLSPSRAGDTVLGRAHVEMAAVRPELIIAGDGGGDGGGGDGGGFGGGDGGGGYGGGDGGGYGGDGAPAGGGDGAPTDGGDGAPAGGGDGTPTGGGDGAPTGGGDGAPTGGGDGAPTGGGDGSPTDGGDGSSTGGGDGSPVDGGDGTSSGGGDGTPPSGGDGNTTPTPAPTPTPTPTPAKDLPPVQVSADRPPDAPTPTPSPYWNASPGDWVTLPGWSSPNDVNPQTDTKNWVEQWQKDKNNLAYAKWMLAHGQAKDPQSIQALQNAIDAAQQAINNDTNVKNYQKNPGENISQNTQDLITAANQASNNAIRDNGFNVVDQNTGQTVNSNDGSSSSGSSSQGTAPSQGQGGDQGGPTQSAGSPSGAPSGSPTGSPDPSTPPPDQGGGGGQEPSPSAPDQGSPPPSPGIPATPVPTPAPGGSSGGARAGSPTGTHGGTPSGTPSPTPAPTSTPAAPTPSVPHPGVPAPSPVPAPTPAPAPSEGGLTPDDGLGAGLTWISSSMDKGFAWVDPKAAKLEEETTKFFHVQYGVAPVVRDIGGAVGGVVTVTELLADAKKGDVEGAFKDAGDGLGAIAGAEAGAAFAGAVGLGTGGVGFIAAPLIIVGFSLLGAYGGKKFGGASYHWIFE